jgi:hypothetical protein
MPINGTWRTGSIASSFANFSGSIYCPVGLESCGIGKYGTSARPCCPSLRLLKPGISQADSRSRGVPAKASSPNCLEATEPIRSGDLRASSEDTFYLPTHRINVDAYHSCNFFRRVTVGQKHRKFSFAALSTAGLRGCSENRGCRQFISCALIPSKPAPVSKKPSKS